MAQDIQIAGATFNAVPSIVVPVAGGGSATFVDPSPTTAAAADVADGKQFFDALGVLTQGTASGGGSGNIVAGSFTASPTPGVAQTIDIPYTGSKHPNFIGIYPSDGFESGSSLYGITHQYAIIEYAFFRADCSTNATYTGSGTNNTGYVILLAKGSSTSNTSASRSNGAAVLSSSAATEAVGTSVRMSSNKKMSIFVSSSSYGFLASTKYNYVIVYSA